MTFFSSLSDIAVVRDFLIRCKREAQKRRLNLFAVAEPHHKPEEGASVFTAVDTPEGAVRAARACQIAWDKAHGIDPYHDWERDATGFLNVLLGQTAQTAKRWVSFPAWEIPHLRKQLAERGFFFSTRVSAEVGKYKRGQVWDSAIGPLFVVISFHYDRLEEVPYYPEIVKTLLGHKRQLEELKALAKERGVDVIIWSKA